MVDSTVMQAGRYKAYPEYKDSGVEWLGEIPSDWEMWKLAHAYESIGSGTTPSTNDESAFDGDIPWITTGELREKVIFDTSKKVSTETLSNYSALKKHPAGSIAIAMYGATIGRLGILGVEATTNQACCVLSKSNVLLNKFLFYWLHAFKEDIVRLSSGGGQPNINQEKVASLIVSTPSLKEQNQVIDFLDHETAKIDTLIEKQQRLIELLIEKRQAVISQAVTKGLNPDVPMKDSGVEWLGEVPAHWDVLPLKYVSESVGTGGTPKSDLSFSVEPEISWFTPGDFSSQFELSSSNKYVTRRSVTLKDSKLFDANSVLIIGIGATLGKVAHSALPFSCNQQINVVTPNKMTSSLFLTYALNNQTEQMVQSSNSSTIGIMNQEKTKSLMLVIPPLNEQVKIVNYLNIEMKRLDTLKEKVLSQMSLMQERRTALISAAVTGKIDVRDWVKPE